MFQIAYLPITIQNAATGNESYATIGYFAGITASYWMIPGTYYHYEVGR